MADGFRWPPFGERHEDARLSALLDDELGDEEALEVTRHVAACDRCLAELESIREARGILRSLPRVDPPDDFYEDVLARASEVAADHEPGRPWRLVAAVAASSLFVAGAAFVAGDDDPGTVSPPVEVFVVDHLARVDGGPVLEPVDLGR